MALITTLRQIRNVSTALLYLRPGRPGITTRRSVSLIIQSFGLNRHIVLSLRPRKQSLVKTLYPQARIIHWLKSFLVTPENVCSLPKEQPEAHQAMNRKTRKSVVLTATIEKNAIETKIKNTPQNPQNKTNFKYI